MTETTTETVVDETTTVPAAEVTETTTSTTETTDWKAEARKHEQRAKANAEAAKELAALKAKDQTETERLAAERDGLSERVKTAQRRAVTAEVKSAAAGLKFTNPGLALRLLDLDALIDDDGEVDEKAVTEALQELASKEPYLLATGTPAPTRSGGPVGGGGGTGQLSRSDLQGMTPQAIEAARKDGRLNTLLGTRSTN